MHKLYLFKKTTYFIVFNHYNTNNIYIYIYIYTHTHTHTHIYIYIYIYIYKPMELVYNLNNQNSLQK
jgi:hypothetical protein